MFIPIRDSNPYRRVPLLTIGLIAVNVYVFLTVGPSPEAFFRFGAVPCDLLERCPELSSELNEAFPERTGATTILTSMFMHGNLLHLGFNMLFLWIFGNNVEDRLGHIRFALFYGLTGIAAAALHIAIHAGSGVPMVGASGAVSGVLGAYLVLWPRARILSIFLLGFIPIPFWLPAWFMLGFWFLIQLLGGLAGLGLAKEGGTAFFAHVGGFVVGLLMIRVFAPSPRGGRPVPADWLRA